jgi:hypothetical protein
MVSHRSSASAVLLATCVSLLALAAGSAGANTLMVWGDDASSQISTAPVGRLKAIAPGGSLNGLALRWDWTPVLWGAGPIGAQPMPDSFATEPFTAVALGRDDAVLIRPDGTLAAFGRNAALTDVPEGTYSAVAVAAVHAVAIAHDGALTAWGSDSTVLPTGEVVTGLLQVPAGGPFRAVSGRSLYMLALHEDGTLYFSGRAPTGSDLLEGWTATPANPAVYCVPNASFKAVAAGNTHALAIRTNGTVAGWGSRAGGALQPPAHVRFKTVAAGSGFSIGLDTNGTLWGWGTPAKSPFAAQAWTFASQGWSHYGSSGHYFIAGTRFKSIAAAAFHVMAITAQ